MNHKSVVYATGELPNTDLPVQFGPGAAAKLSVRSTEKIPVRIEETISMVQPISDISLRPVGLRQNYPTITAQLRDPSRYK